MIDECSALEMLVNQLLLLAETEADALKIHGERVRLDELVQQSVGMFEGVADYKGIALRAEVSAEAAVEGNRHHLRQVLNNLIDNAIKFTPQDGRITVELDRDDVKNLAILRVRDSGQGIAADDLPHVFERFFRSDRSRPREGETRGTGLGLSICEAVVKSHGGRISVTSDPGKGATFTVSMPLAQNPNGEGDEISREGQGDSHSEMPGE
jgi:signal transduction histidine kinase